MSIKPPTRWTVRAVAIDAILRHYEVLMDTIEEVKRTTDDEQALKAGGVPAALEKFKIFFGLKLGHLLFGPAEEMSKTL